jgi:hypothetical protein
MGTAILFHRNPNSNTSTNFPVTRQSQTSLTAWRFLKFLQQCNRWSGLMGCEAASLGKWFLTLPRNASPSSSKFQVLFFFIGLELFELRFHFFRNVGNHLPSHTVISHKTQILDYDVAKTSEIAKFFLWILTWTKPHVAIQELLPANKQTWRR